MIQPEKKSKTLLGVTRAKAKMYEYDVPLAEHIDISAYSLVNLIDLTIAMIGDLAVEHDRINPEEEKYKLIFSARYFDSLTNTETITDGLDYLRLLASVSYYLGGYPGSSKLVAGLITDEGLVPSGLLAKALTIILGRKKANLADFEQYEFTSELAPVLIDWNTFRRDGLVGTLFDSVSALRKKIYADGNDRDLLLIDVRSPSRFYNCYREQREKRK